MGGGSSTPKETKEDAPPAAASEAAAAAPAPEPEPAANADPMAPIDYSKPPKTKPLYGRWAGMSPGTDPRLDKSAAQTYAAFEMLGVSPPNGEKQLDDYQQVVQTMAPDMAEYTQFCSMMTAKAPRYNASRKDIEIDGVDGNKVPLSIYQGTSKTCYYFVHGGGMSTLSCRYEPYALLLNNWNGKHGMTVVAVDFRNYFHHPDEKVEVAQFPAGLNDCYAGLEWVHEHKAELGCETVVIFGESGGGNLTLTTTLKTLKEGRPELLDGTFAMCPYTDSNVFSDRYPSIVENDGYDLAVRNRFCQESTWFYTSKEEDRTNPLAWPTNAGPDLLKGMKPVVISVNELDPLRDCGLEFYRKLLAAGVQAQARTVAGTMHGTDIMPFDTQLHFDTTTNAIKSFAAGLRGKVLVEADAPAPAAAPTEEQAQEQPPEEAPEPEETESKVTPIEKEEESKLTSIED